MLGTVRRHHHRVKAIAAALVVLAGTSLYATLGASTLAAASSPAAASGYTPAATGELDCNGLSPLQKPLRPMNCTDIRGFDGTDNANTWGGKFYDNGVYIGHDEPDLTFLSGAPGTGDNVSWTITLGRDPAAPPGDANPGSDVSHWFELTPAPWLSMAICDPNSYPQAPCTPNSDSNAPACSGPNCPTASNPGGGSAFLEMQFYPPGNPPWVDSESCDDTHWCAALTIDSLECTNGFAVCNPNCEEPVNFAFVQRNGVPAGPPAPQTSTLASAIPNAETLLMNPGDQVNVNMFDAPAPGGGAALEVVIFDLTQHTFGFMQASAHNGFQTTSMADCSGTPFNFQPEYLTASPANVIPWAALQTDISTEFETGHFEPCTTLSEPLSPNPFDAADTGGTFNQCSGPYETAGGPEGPETGDALCYQAGDTHPGYDGAGSSTPPDEATGCQDNLFQNGDLDFDGTPYWPEWPTGTTPNTFPSSFVESTPTSFGRPYSRFFFQTDIALSEASCTPTTLSGCTVPPAGPGHFYPYWSEVGQGHGFGSGFFGAGCTFEFGNVSSGFGTTDFGKDAQYGADQFTQFGYPEFEGQTYNNTCPARPASL